MRLRSSFLAVAALASGIALIASGAGRASEPSPSPSGSASPVASTSPDSSAAPNAAAVTVDTKDFAYAPQSITVATGTKVTFKNSDSTPHTVTSDDKSFDSGNMDQNATWSHIFAKAGTYKYTCAYHAFMHGTVIVKE